MIDPDFDPYQALLNTDRNVQTLIHAHNNLAQQVEHQQQVIDTLVKGLDAANKANELLLAQAVTNWHKNFNSQGQH
jgi:hypothetical protein